MLRAKPRAVPIGDVDEFLVELLDQIRQYNGMVEAQSGLNREVLSVDIDDLVMDFVGIPVERLEAGECGEATDTPGQYARDHLPHLFDCDDKDAVRRLVAALRAEAREEATA